MRNKENTGRPEKRTQNRKIGDRRPEIKLPEIWVFFHWQRNFSFFSGQRYFFVSCPNLGDQGKKPLPIWVFFPLNAFLVGFFLVALYCLAVGNSAEEQIIDLLRNLKKTGAIENARRNSGALSDFQEKTERFSAKKRYKDHIALRLRILRKHENSICFAT